MNYQREIVTIILFWFSIVLSNNSFAQQEKNIASQNAPLRISIMSVNPPFSMLSSSGKPIGLYVDIWKLWSKKNGIPVVFVPEIYSDNVETLKRGDADFHAGLFINPQRLEWADFSIPIHSMPTHIFVNDNAKFLPKIQELSNRLVGVGEDSFQDTYLMKYYPEVKRATFVDYEKVVHRLLRGEVDAIVSEAPYVDSQLALMGIKGAIKRSDLPLTVNTVHALVPKGNRQLVELINLGISRINTSELIDLEKKWLPNYPAYFAGDAIEFLASLSFEQQTWLRKKENFIFGYNQALPPLEFKHETNGYSGIGSDYLEIISDMLNVKMTPSTSKRWVETVVDLKAEQIDLVPIINQEQRLKNNIHFTDSYLDFSNVIVTRTKGTYIQNIEDLSGSKVGVVEHYKIAQTIKKLHPKIQLLPVKDIQEGIRKVQSGDVFAFVGNLAVVSHYIKQGNLKDVKVASFTPYTSQLSLGVRAGLEPLIPILNQALSAISDKQKNNISNAWRTYQINRNANIAQIVSWSLVAFLFSALIIAYVIRSNKKMQLEIAQRIQVEQRLEQETIYAQKMNRAKDEFLSNMSHEIRTPMNAIVGTANLLKLSSLDDEQKDYLKTMNLSADVLLHLIDDIIDLSEIGAGGMALNLKQFNLRELLLSLIKQASARIVDENAVVISSHISDDIPQYIIGDPMRLGQLITNFLSNAVKFTAKGEIIISAKSCQSSVDKGEKIANNLLRIVFCVEDTGIGMSKLQQETLFQAYYQADSSITRRYGGTGLGLSICKSICQSMSGDVWVESELGKGSRFFFSAIFERLDQEITSPINQVLTQNNSHQIFKSGDKDNITHTAVELGSTKMADIDAVSFYASLLSKKKVLIVDDNLINIAIAKKMLEKVGVVVSTAMNGVESLEKLKESEVDLVLMDLQMPVMDGFQATKLIRENSRLSELPVIAFSANVMQKDIDQAITAGMNAHLAKPLKFQTLLKVLVEQLKLCAQQQPSDKDTNSLFWRSND